MLEKIKNFFKNANEIGLNVPLAKDSSLDGKPSSLLLFAYIGFTLAIVSDVYLILKDALMGTVLAISIWVLALVFYRMRRLEKVKFDLDDKSFELESDDKDDDKKEENPKK